MIQRSIIVVAKHDPIEQTLRHENMIQWSIISVRKHDPMINYLDAETWSTDQLFHRDNMIHWSIISHDNVIVWSTFRCSNLALLFNQILQVKFDEYNPR